MRELNPRKKGKLLIFLYNYRFSKIDWERFEISYFQKYYDVVIHDLLDLIHPNYHVGFKNIYKNKIIYKYNNFFSWAKSIYKFLQIYKRNNIYILTPICGEAFVEKLILTFLILLRFKIINDNIPGVALPENVSIQKKTFYIFQKLKKFFILKNYYYLNNIIFRYFLSFLATKRFAILTNSSNFEKIKISYPFSQYIKGSSRDYSLYLREVNKNVNDLKDLIPTKYALHIDGVSPGFIGDEFLLNQTNPESIESWYGKLNNLFEFLEIKYNLKFIIAAHPKTDVKKVSHFYNGRKAFLGITKDLIRNSEFVTNRQSTAISYAIIYRKPIIFLTSDKLQTWESHTYNVRPILNALNKEQLNIDDLSYKNNFKIPKVVLNDYLMYERKYLSSSNLPNYQTIINFFEESIY